MKKWIIFFAVFCLILGKEGWSSSQPPVFHAFHPWSADLPSDPFEDQTGQSFSLKDLKGFVLLVVFWATWCPSCVEEAEALDQLADSLKDKKFKLLALSHDKNPLAVESFYAVKGIKNTPIYFDKGMKLGRSFGIRGVPTAFLINAEGTVVGRLEGSAPWNNGEAKALIEYYLPA